MRNKVAKIIIGKTVDSVIGQKRWARVMYRGKCLMSVNVRKQKTPCDLEDIENAEIEAYMTCREYALSKGFSSVERVYE